MLGIVAILAVTANAHASVAVGAPRHSYMRTPRARPLARRDLACMVSKEADDAIQEAVRKAEAKERPSYYEREVAAAVMLVNRAVHLCRALAEDVDAAESQAPGVEMSQDQATRGMSAIKGGDSTPVTAGDFAIQAIASEALGKWFPGDMFMGEEDSAALRDDPELCRRTQELSGLEEGAMLDAIDRGTQPIAAGQRYWVLDPIDGTKGFLTGQQYIIGLALIDGDSGEPVVGVMGSPNLHPEPCVMAAVKGGGTRMFFADDPRSPPRRADYEMRENAWAETEYDIAALDADGGAGAELEAGVDYPPWLLSRPMVEGSPLPFGARAAPGDVCCGALVKYWSVAVGAHAGFIQYAQKLKTWDHAAGVICVRESGGQVTDVDGLPVTFPGRSVPVSGGVICSSRECTPSMRERLVTSVRDARANGG